MQVVLAGGDGTSEEVSVGGEKRDLASLPGRPFRHLPGCQRCGGVGAEATADLAFQLAVLRAWASIVDVWISAAKAWR